jgi:hypothetical protein
MTPSAREAAEKWLLFRFTHAHTLEEQARIAADFAERLALASVNAKMLDRIFHDSTPLPWAEATKEGGE